MKKPSPRRADRSPERCLAGGGLLGGKDPAGRFPLNVVSSVINGFARTPNQRANGQRYIVSGYCFSAGGRLALPEHNARNRARTRNFFSGWSKPVAGHAVDRRPGPDAGVSPVLFSDRELVCDTMKKPSPRRADRSPERCRAGGDLLGGKDPAGRCLGNRSEAPMVSSSSPSPHLFSLPVSTSRFPARAWRTSQQLFGLRAERLQFFLIPRRQVFVRTRSTSGLDRSSPWPSANPRVWHGTWRRRTGQRRRTVPFRL